MKSAKNKVWDRLANQVREQTEGLTSDAITDQMIEQLSEAIEYHVDHPVKCRVEIQLKRVALAQGAT